MQSTDSGENSSRAGAIGCPPRMPREHLDERRELDRRLEHADVAGAAQERLGSLRDQRDQVGAVKQDLSEQEAVDAELDVPRDAEPGKVQVGQRDVLAA